VEHRWGERIPLDMPVKIDACSQAVVRGRILNVSLSGAFIQINVSIPAWAQVCVDLDLQRSRRSDRFRVEAYVVRATDQGIGIEWEEFAPRAIRALFAILRTRDVVHTPDRCPITVEYGRRLPVALHAVALDTVAPEQYALTRIDQPRTAA
jgi:PilZ domain